MNIISLKMEDQLLKDIDSSLTINRYSTRTEFIRDAIRAKLIELEKERAIRGLAKLRGSVKNIKRLSKDELDKLAYEHWEEKKKGINSFEKHNIKKFRNL
ncbi:MAG: hypothetical protein ABIB43_04750 [archaeon]